jgi:hypothetical protein
MRTTAAALKLPLHDEIEAPDGGRARLVGAAIELRDAEGRLLVRYVDGCAEIAPASGDLKLRAPAGAVEIEAATDVRITSARDVLIEGKRAVQSECGAGKSRSSLRLDPRKTTVSTPSLDARARTTQISAFDAKIVARTIRMSAEQIATQAEELTANATRVVELSRERVMEIADRFETKAGRIQSTVRDVYALLSKRTTLLSSDDVSIDGRRVLLG